MEQINQKGNIYFKSITYVFILKMDDNAIRLKT